MISLPIVERELRVACRRPSYIRSRIWVGVVVMAFAGILLGLHALQGGNGGGLPVSPGKLVFETFKWMSFIAACFSGVVLTADCLSNEKREGTLGLLFLTDLRGYDVVLGKLATHALHAVYAYLAAFPVVGSCFVMGGVSGGEFVRLLLVLFLTLFLSLSIGLLASALCRETIRTMTLTLGIILFLTIGLVLVDGLLASRPGGTFGSWITRFSPSCAIWEVGYAGNRRFLESLACLSGLGIACLGASCLIVPRTWQTAPAGQNRPRAGAATVTAETNPLTSLPARRRTVLARDPMEWLIRTLYPAGWIVWIPVSLTLASVIVAVCLRLHLGSPASMSARQMIGTMTDLALTVFIRLWLAVQAVRFWTDARANGAMELLLVTPIRPKQIVDGHWRALCRTFLPPMLIVMLITGVIGYAQMEDVIATNRLAWAANPSMSVAEVEKVLDDLRHLILVHKGFQLVGQLTNFWVIAWMGIWMGMITRRTPVAVGKTLLVGDFLPMVGMYLLQFLVVALGGAAILGNPDALGLTLGFTSLTINILLGWFARARARARFPTFIRGSSGGSQV